MADVPTHALLPMALQSVVVDLAMNSPLMDVHVISSIPVPLTMADANTSAQLLLALLSAVAGLDINWTPLTAVHALTLMSVPVMEAKAIVTISAPTQLDLESAAALRAMNFKRMALRVKVRP